VRPSAITGVADASGGVADLAGGVADIAGGTADISRGDAFAACSTFAVCFAFAAPRGDASAESRIVAEEDVESLARERGTTAINALTARPARMPPTTVIKPTFVIRRLRRWRAAVRASWRQYRHVVVPRCPCGQVERLEVSGSDIEL